MDDYIKILDELVKMEINTSKLYMFFSEIYNEDKDFWIEISLEEQKHASVIESWKNFIEQGLFPIEYLFNNIDNIKKINKVIDDLIISYRNEIPVREDAYKKAIEFEKKSGEAYFQGLMNKKLDNELIKIFQELVNDEKNHAVRINELLNI